MTIDTHINVGSKPTNKTIHVVKEFKPVPMWRSEGKDFREKFLLANIQEGVHVIVDFNDEVAGFAPSFLEEAFGGLIRQTHYSMEEFNEKISIIDDSGYYKELVFAYVEEEIERDLKTH